MRHPPRYRRHPTISRSRLVLGALFALGIAGCGDSVGPGGQREQIVFLRQSDVTAGSTSASTSPDLYRVNGDGSGLTRLATLTGLHGAVSPSPDGRRVAYASDLDNAGSPRIWIMNTDGTNPRPLTTGRDDSPRWSPDGTRIAFARWTMQQGFDVYVVGADGGNPVNVSAGVRTMGTGCERIPTGITPIHWLPGGRIGFETYACGTTRTYTVNADGGGVAESEIDLRFAAWSPDGSRVAFLRMEGQYERVVVMNADGSGARVLTSAGRHQHLIAANGGNSPWSPDGRRLLFYGDPPLGDGGSGCVSGPTAPYVINADGSGLRRAGTICGWFNGWSPSGDRISQISQRDGVSDVYLTSVDDGETVNLTQSPEAESYVSWLRGR